MCHRVRHLCDFLSFSNFSECTLLLLYRLICHQNDGIAGEEIPGCGGYITSASDYCVDPNDYTQGVLFMPTGGWNDDWLQTPKVEVTLVAGINTIKLQIPTGYRTGKFSTLLFTNLFRPELTITPIS